MAKARQYHTLCTLDDGQWSPQFGDYSLQTVKDEVDDMLSSGAAQYKRKQVKIITTGDRQADIIACVAELNKKAA